MSRVFRAAFLLSAIATALALSFLGATFGITFLVLLGLAGVPLVLLGALCIHYVTLAQRAGDLGGAQKRHFVASALRLEARLKEAVVLAARAGLPPAEVDRLLAEARAVLEPYAQVRVEEGEVALALSSELPGGNWVRRSEGALQKVFRDAAARAAPVLEERMAGFATQPASSLPRDDLPSLCRAYLEVRDASAGRINASIEAVEKAISDVETDLEVEDAWNHVRSARKLWEAGQTELALKALQDAEAIVHEHLRPAFDSRRQALLDCIEQVRRMEVLTVGNPAIAESLTRLQKEASKRDLRAAGLAGIEADEQRFAPLLNDLAREARAKARRVKETLLAYPGLADPEALDEVVQMVDAAPEVKHPYQADFPAWYDRMRHAFERLHAYHGDADLIRWMPRLEQFISSRLKEGLDVAPPDLPVRERAAQILSIYARMHPAEAVLEDGVLRAPRRVVHG